MPETSNPAEVPTVVRMASIPHGTTVLAQGIATLIGGPPTITNTNIIPFVIGNPTQKNSVSGVQSCHTEQFPVTSGRYCRHHPGDARQPEFCSPLRLGGEDGQEHDRAGRFRRTRPPRCSAAVSPIRHSFKVTRLEVRTRRPRSSPRRSGSRPSRVTPVVRMFISFNIPRQFC